MFSVCLFVLFLTYRAESVYFVVWLMILCNKTARSVYFTLFLSIFLVSIPKHTFGLTNLTEYIKSYIILMSFLSTQYNFHLLIALMETMRMESERERVILLNQNTTLPSTGHTVFRWVL